MLNCVAPAGLRDKMSSNSVRETNTAVKTLASKPKTSVVAKPRIGPVPNWNRKAAAISDDTCVSTMVQKTRSNPALTACLALLSLEGVLAALAEFRRRALP